MVTTSCKALCILIRFIITLIRSFRIAGIWEPFKIP
jgi:hypothetical protein